MKPIFKNTLVLMFVWPVLIMTTNLCAEPASPDQTSRQALETFFETINAVKFPVMIAADYDRETALADAYLDLASMGKKAMGGNWDVLNADQRKEFIALLERLVRAIAYPRAQKFLSAQTVTYAEPKPIARGVEITSTTKSKETGLEIPIVYDLYAEGRQWKIYDVYLDGISMTEDLQYQFDKLIADGGPAELLKQMQVRLERADRENAAAA